MNRKMSQGSMQAALSRRDFLGNAGLALAGAVLASRGGSALADTPASAQPLPITVAGYDFDRFADLANGRVEIAGCQTTFVSDRIGDMNSDVFSGKGSREVSEVGLHPFMLAYANEGFRDYALLPIFPLRLFRHKSVFIRRDRGINRPEDLRGKRIATPGYSSTSLTWIRGLLEDEYGVAATDVEWVIAAGDSSADTAGTVSAQERVLPKGVSISTGPEGQDESELLESGAVDALFHAAEPRAYAEGHTQVARLFPDYRKVEQAYYEKTGIFPIMHAVAIRRDVAEQHPWLAKAVFDAYSLAKTNSYQRMARLGWASDMLPWYGQELAETRALMGANFYSYGVPANRKALETLCRYSHQQGLASRELALEELFLPGSLAFSEAAA